MTKAKKPKTADFNRGTVPYEIVIQQYTIINNIGSFDLKANIENRKLRQLVLLQDIPTFLNKFIRKYTYNFFI